MSRCCERAALVVVLVVSASAFGCEGLTRIGLERDVPPPVIVEVSPATASAGDSARLAIVGRDFHPRVYQDLGSLSGVGLDDTFVVSLGGHALRDVHWRSEGLLEASAPSTLSPGRYDLRVQTPNGLEATLVRAFAVLPTRSPLTLELLATPARTSTGGLVSVTARVSNQGSHALSGVVVAVPEAVPAGGMRLTGGEARSHPALGAGESVDVPFTFEADAPGTVTLLAHADALDTLTNEPISPALASSAPVAVHAPAALAVTLAAEPLRMLRGQTENISVTVSNSGDTPARAVTPSLVSADVVVDIVQGPTPATAEVPAGGSATFRFVARAVALGAEILSSTANGEDAYSLLPVGAAPGSLLVVVEEPPALSLAWSAWPARVSYGQTLPASLVISNAGDVDVVDVVLQLPEPAGGTLTWCEAAASSSWTVPARASTTVALSCTAGPLSGHEALTARVSGLSAFDGAAVGSPLVTSESFLVQSPASLALAWHVPVGGASGRAFTATLAVTNSGEADALDVMPSVLALGGETQTSCLDPLPSSRTIVGGATAAFTFECRAGPLAGAATFSAGAMGSDANSGASTSAAAITSAPFEVIAAAFREVVINEVVTRPRHDWSDSDGGSGIGFDHAPGFGVVDAGDQWIELYNASGSALDLTGYTLSLQGSELVSFAFGADASDRTLRFSSGGSITSFAPGEYLVVGSPAGTAVMDDDVWITLDTPAGTRADEVALGASLGGDVDGTHNAPSGAGSSLAEAVARAPNGQDTGDDGVDFVAAAPTPGRHNGCPTRSAIALASSSSNGGSGANAWAHTVLGYDAALLVVIATRSAPVLGVQYAGAPLVEAGAMAGPRDELLSFFWLTSPAIGAHEISIDVADSAPLAAGAVTLTGVQQADALSALAFKSSNAGIVSLETPVSTTGAVVVDAVAFRGATAVSASAPQSELWAIGASQAEVGLSASLLGPLPAPGMVTTSWQLSPPRGGVLGAGLLLGQCQ